MALLHERTNASAVAARGVRDVYLVPDGEREVEGLERKELMNAVEGLRGIISAGKGLERVSRDLLGSLYEKEFNVSSGDGDLWVSCAFLTGHLPTGLRASSFA